MHMRISEFVHTTVRDVQNVPMCKSYVFGASSKLFFNVLKNGNIANDDGWVQSWMSRDVSQSRLSLVSVSSQSRYANASSRSRTLKVSENGPSIETNRNIKKIWI